MLIELARGDLRPPGRLQPVQADARRDAAQPRSEFPPISERTESQKAAEQRLLRQIFRRVGVPGPGVTQSQNLSGPSAHEFPVRHGAARQGLVDQFGI